MNITLENISKKYGKTWILKNVNLNFEQGKKYAILGNNGSGKSTLMKIISSQTTASRGDITFENTDIDKVYQKLSFCAPYIDVIEELTFEELLTFVSKYKPFMAEFSTPNILKLFNFQSDKWIKDYSSGMKQRVKLALALFADVEVTLLDEPTSNLDEAGVEWYFEMLEKLPKNRTIIIASNIEREYQFCEHLINIKDFK